MKLYEASSMAQLALYMYRVGYYEYFSFFFFLIDVPKINTYVVISISSSVLVKKFTCRLQEYEVIPFKRLDTNSHRNPTSILKSGTGIIFREVSQTIYLCFLTVLF